LKAPRPIIGVPLAFGFAVVAEPIYEFIRSEIGDLKTSLDSPWYQSLIQYSLERIIVAILAALAAGFAIEWLVPSGKQLIFVVMAAILISALFWRA
jgi:hypothetical protein